MFGLLRFLFSLFILAVVLWFATNVQLGSRTLWGHIKAISETKEAHELAEGTKQEAKKVAEKLLEHDGGTRPEAPKPEPKVESKPEPAKHRR